MTNKAKTCSEFCLLAGLQRLGKDASSTYSSINSPISLDLNHPLPLLVANGLIVWRTPAKVLVHHQTIHLKGDEVLTEREPAT